MSHLDVGNSYKNTFETKVKSERIVRKELNFPILKNDSPLLLKKKWATLSAEKKNKPPLR